MDLPTIKFIAFTLFSVSVFVFGYVARRRQWLDERHSRTVHFHTVVWGWSLGSMLSVWKLPIEWESGWLLPLLILLMVLPMLGMAWLVRVMRLPADKAGVLVVGAGFSNLGFTLGAYLCYVLIDHEHALGFAGTVMAIFNIAMVLIGYPVARWYSVKAGAQTGSTNLWQLMGRSLSGWTSLPIYTAIVGLALSMSGVPFPRMIEQVGLLDIMMFGIAFGGYLGVGMRVRVDGFTDAWREHAALAAFKFVITPAVGFGLIALVAATPWPMHHAAEQVFQLMGFMPAGITMVILANLFHLDARFAGRLWLWNMVIFCVFVLPLILWIMS